MKPSELSEIKERLYEAEKTFQIELQYTDSISLQIEEKSLEKDVIVYTEEHQKKITDSLVLLPYGVAGYSYAISGLVETSMNMGALTCEDGTLTLLIAMRSSIESQKYMLRDKIQIIAEDYCDNYIFESDYPGWQYRKDSKLRDTAITLYEKLFDVHSTKEKVSKESIANMWTYMKELLKELA